MRRILLLGASGSIGQQTLDVIKSARDEYQLVAFSLGEKTEMISQIVQEHPNVECICIKHNNYLPILKKQYPNIKIMVGDRGLMQIVKTARCDMVVNALVGFVGFLPTIEALKRNLIVCLANKESLVVGGEIINDLLSRGSGKLFPIDSEHVALSKCLKNAGAASVKRLIITASGGAFRDKSLLELKSVTPSEALHHPTWQMGAKITIDSATMMNKGFELIEAYYLFGYPLSQIDILMHDESHVHSLVELADGTLIGDISKPDMRVPIAYALSLGNIPYEVWRGTSLLELKDFHFHEFDPIKYPCVELAKKALADGGTAPAVLNAINEVGVYAFLDNRIPFLDIAKYVELFLNNTEVKKQTVRNVVQADKKTRLQARKLLGI